MPRLADVVELVHGWYPPGTAADWDAVGLAAGDPEAVVRRVVLAVDPVLPVAREAAAWGADLLLTHHPLFLRGVHGVSETTPKGRTLAELTRAGCGLLTAHTNADHGNPGVSDAIARAFGVRDVRPVAPTGPALDKIVVYVPDTHAEQVRVAIAEAGAGRIGDYDSCSWTIVGEGRFRPLPGAHPVIGTVGDLELVAEARVEAVLPRSRRTDVVRAMLDVHPYEEVAYDIVELADPGTADTGAGRIGDVDPVPLGDFAAQVASALPATARGVLVGGDLDRVVRRVAVNGGAGDSLLPQVLAGDADVYVTSDLRHHLSSEFLEQGGPALVDVSHWAAEWTWLPELATRLQDELGDTVEVRVSTLCTDVWQARR
ncbi:YqfO family protein [Nocardioides cynanchi]|uniref:Nif3-like dinuclear metal center hexameric protein n=1 Tax=Nocardioides cynanchi TaxID=2558918 RepID=UPI0012480540|nr:Nif3-like dinuclear metal center hexameric protein [Nocardioides cynanchi]